MKYGCMVSKMRQNFGQDGLHGLLDGLLYSILHRHGQGCIQSVENPIQTVELAGQRLTRLTIAGRSWGRCCGHGCYLHFKG